MRAFAAAADRSAGRPNLGTNSSRNRIVVSRLNGLAQRRPRVHLILGSHYSYLDYSLCEKWQISEQIFHYYFNPRYFTLRYFTSRYFTPRYSTPRATQLGRPIGAFGPSRFLPLQFVCREAKDLGQKWHLAIARHEMIMMMQHCGEWARLQMVATICKILPILAWQWQTELSGVIRCIWS